MYPVYTLVENLSLLWITEHLRPAEHLYTTTGTGGIGYGQQAIGQVESIQDKLYLAVPGHKTGRLLKKLTSPPR